MTDIASLKIEVDATSADKAIKSVENLNKSTDNLSTATEKLKKSNLNSWATMNAISAAEDAASDKAWALANGYKEVGGQLIKTSEEIGKSAASLTGLGLNTQFARREIMTLGKEALTGDFSRIPKTFSTLITHSNLLAAAMSPIGLAVIGVTAAVTASIFAWNEWGDTTAKAQRQSTEGLQSAIDLAAKLRSQTLTTDEKSGDIIKEILRITVLINEAKERGRKDEEESLKARTGPTGIVVPKGIEFIKSVSTESNETVKKLIESIEYLKRKLVDLADKNKPDAKAIKDAILLQKAKLDFDLGNIRNAADEEINISKNKEKLLNEDKQNRLISDADYYEKKREFIIKGGQATSKELSDILAGYEKEKFSGKEKIENDTKIAKVQSEIRRAYENTTTALELIDKKQDEMRKKTDWTHGITTSLRKFKEEAADVAGNVERMMLTMSNGIVDGVAGSISKSIIYGKNLEDSLTSVAQNVADAFITSLIKIGIQQLFVNETLKAGYVLQVASQSQATAFMAAENAFSATALIPIVGPELAPAAAAAAYETASSFGYAAVASASARDGFDIPAGVNPVTQLHEKEMVLPAPQAQVIRDMAKNGGAGNQIVDNTVINIDSRSDRIQVMKDVQRMIENGHARLVDKLQRQRALA